MIYDCQTNIEFEIKKSSYSIYYSALFLKKIKLKVVPESHRSKEIIFNNSWIYYKRRKIAV